MTRTASELSAGEVGLKGESVTPGTLLAFLIGHEGAIKLLARCRATVWIGLLFVISAGFAREYDGESLVHEPWHLLLPLGASLVTSLLLFSLLALVSYVGNSFSGSFGRGYRQFLGLYWMTAPLAWLYASPVERFLSPADAVRVNLLFLAVVSFWRVALMTRVISVVFQCRVISAFVLVMLFADAVALSILYLTPMPIFDIMGGIRLTESEQVIQSAHLMIGAAGLLTGPIWLTGGLIILIASWKGKKAICVWKLELSDDIRVSVPTWVVAAGSIAFGAALLPFAQAEQYNRWQVKHAFAQGRIADGVRYMAERRRSEFPPHWDPPPRIGYGEFTPSLVEVLDHLELSKTKGWVRQIFVDKLRFQSGRDHGQHFWLFRLEDLSDEELSRHVRMIESLPDGDMIAWSHEDELYRVAPEEDLEHTPQRQELYQRLRDMANRYRAKRERESGGTTTPKESPARSPAVYPSAPAGQQLQSDAQ